MNTNRTIAAATAKPGMSADRKAAVWIGVLYIIGTVALVLSLVVTGAVLTGPAYLAQVAAQPNQLAVGALLVLLAGFALAMVPVVFWPIGRRYDETLAMGYVVFRGAIETVIYIATALGWLLLVALSTQPDAGPIAGLVRTIEAVAWDQLVAIPFVLGALMFYVLLYRSRLVPRWLSAWGLVGAALYIVPPLGNMFGLSLGVLMVPLAVQEMVLAVWLIAKGFNPRAVAASAGDRDGACRSSPRWQRREHCDRRADAKGAAPAPLVHPHVLGRPPSAVQDHRWPARPRPCDRRQVGHDAPATIGRRTGEERTVILGYFEDGPNLVTMAMNGWADPEPAWWLNLQAHPDATVDLAGGRALHATAADREERPRLWARWAHYDKDLVPTLPGGHARPRSSSCRRGSMPESRGNRSVRSTV